MVWVHGIYKHRLEEGASSLYAYAWVGASDSSAYCGVVSQEGGEEGGREAGEV